MLYLYALTDHPTAIPTTQGLEGSPLAAERVDGIDAVVSVVDGTVEPTEEAVVAHARVVEELAALNAAVLPARFGRGYNDTDSLRQSVVRRAEALDRALDRVRGCVELGLRVLADRTEASASGETGRAYMLGRLEERRQAERLAGELHRPLAKLARAETHSVGATSQLLLTGSYLVPRDQLERFRSAVRELGSEHPELTLACTGPWAAYSFATAELESE